MRLLLILLLLASPAYAQTDRYRIEVVVFAYNNPDANTALTKDDADPDFDGMLMGSGGEIYSVLPGDQRQLTGASDALARHARTRALVHTAWVQDASNRSVRLRGEKTVEGGDAARGVLAASMPELDGDIQVRIGRGIEVDLDALLRAPLKGELARYHLKQKRVVLAGEVHYFDHPALGVIVRVDPLAPAGDAVP